MTAIDDKHAQVRDLLGSPTTSELPTPDGIGRFRHYQRGSIYFTPSTGAHEIHGVIKNNWAELGFERSVLDYPTTDENTCPDNVGRFNHFQHGSIYWIPSTGAHESRGDHHQMGPAGFRAELPGLPHYRRVSDL
jgi:uncharacterized protein with LGFP repeats